MTRSESDQIVQYQAAGYGYRRIAALMDLPVNTVKSFCARHSPKQTAKLPPVELCPVCGRLLEHIPHKRRKRFCSDDCRLSWWAEHPAEMNRKAFYSFQCEECGKEFTSYGNAKRKYCSVECYRKAVRERTGKSDG